MRLDGKAFHTLTRRCEKPFDNIFSDCMKKTAIALCSEIQGSKCAYVQSDEISILISDFDKLNTSAWFDYNIQKMTSIAASIASVTFTKNFFIDGYGVVLPPQLALFDCRVFNIPKEEVCNYFIWRQKDWERNSIHMLAQSHFSHNELMNKNQSDIHEMLYGKGVNWSKLSNEWKNGIFVYQHFGWRSSAAPEFSKCRSAIDGYFEGEEK